MNDFYNEWKDRRDKGNDDSLFISKFLEKNEVSTEPMLTGDIADLELLFFCIDKIPIESFIEQITVEPISYELTSVDIPCFSNLKDGASRLNELLEFSPNGLSFSEAGYQLMNSVNKAARVKYGENHAKLASMMSLVVISENRPAIIRSTAWGSYLIRFNWSSKEGVLKKLLLRDPCIKTFIKNATNEPLSYINTVRFLSRSTAIRRRTNVKCLLEFILINSEYEYILSHIDWEV